MDFPSLCPWSCPSPPKDLIEGLGARTDRIKVLQIKDNYFAVYESEDEVRSVKPDFSRLERLHPAGVAVTAPGTNGDFVSRYFAPSHGVPEDPVTGSTHCSLTPYWARQLGKSTLHAHQISQRGGELWCEITGDRVVIKGKAVLALQGSLSIG
jgi:predicted PhzF superfamily epimerase YddE/YHI9